MFIERASQRIFAENKHVFDFSAVKKFVNIIVILRKFLDAPDFLHVLVVRGIINVFVTCVVLWNDSHIEQSLRVVLFFKRYKTARSFSVFAGYEHEVQKFFCSFRGYVLFREYYDSLRIIIEFSGEVNQSLFKEHARLFEQVVEIFREERFLVFVKSFYVVLDEYPVLKSVRKNEVIHGFHEIIIRFHVQNLVRFERVPVIFIIRYYFHFRAVQRLGIVYHISHDGVFVIRFRAEHVNRIGVFYLRKGNVAFGDSPVSVSPVEVMETFDVICFNSRAREFLYEVKFFVRHSRSREESVFIWIYRRDFLNNNIERFFKSNFFKFSVDFQQRLQKALSVVKITVTEFRHPANASEPVYCSFAARDFHHESVVMVYLYRASGRAEVADCFERFQFERSGFELKVFRHRRRRAGGYAHPAGFAGRIKQACAHAWRDVCLESPVYESERVCPDDVLANPDASGAENAFVVVNFNIRMPEINIVFFIITLEFFLLGFVVCRIPFKVAGIIFRTSAFEASFCFFVSGRGGIAEFHFFEIPSLVRVECRHFFSQLLAVFTVVIFRFLLFEVIPLAYKFILCSCKRKPREILAATNSRLFSLSNCFNQRGGTCYSVTASEHAFNRSLECFFIRVNIPPFVHYKFFVRVLVYIFEEINVCLLTNSRENIVEFHFEFRAVNFDGSSSA